MQLILKATCFLNVRACLGGEGAVEISSGKGIVGASGWHRW